MSKCVSCEYALYDGMCMAQGKYTVLDANSCELYRQTQGYEVSRLKRENVKLRELVNDMWICIAHGSEGWDCTGCRRDPDSVCIMGISEFSQRMRELGIEVK